MENYKLEPSIGSMFSEVAGQAKEIAHEKTFNPTRIITVEYDFNGIMCLVDWDTNLEHLARDYKNAHLMGWKTIGSKCVSEYSKKTIKEMEEKREASRIESEKRMTAYRAEEAVKRKDLEAKLKGIKIELLDVDGWNKSLEANSKDGYGKACLDYAENWAKLMQYEVANGKTIAECESRTSHEADTDGITVFMQGCAVNVLRQCWIYGEELNINK
jgi:hypothetical protein